MKLKRILKRAALAAIALCAVGLYGSYLAVQAYQSRQYAEYNAGMQIFSYKDQACNQAQVMDPLQYHCFDANETIKRWEGSIAAYQQESDIVQNSWWRSELVSHQLLPKPSLPMVALAHFQESKVYFAAQNAQAALSQLKACIDLDPGEQDDPALAKEENSTLRLTVLDCRHNYELYMAQTPSKANNEGKSGGQGKRKGPDAELKPGEKMPSDADPAAKQDRHKL